MVHASVSASTVPVPFRQFVLKVHSRCNLACSYCYVYEMADQSWRRRPPRMADATVQMVADRIAEHAIGHQLESVGVVLHGGEPLLAGAEGIRDVVTRVRSAVPATMQVSISVQTNGLLLDEGFLDLFVEHGVKVGVSLDGGREANDRRRRHRSGRGSYEQVARALGLLQREPYRAVYGGLLCTIDVDNDPVRTFTEIARFEPPTIDLLFPHAHWAAPPPGHRMGETPYADWLIAVFDHWYGAPAQPVRVRLFEELMIQLLGGKAVSEVVGHAPMDFIVVETDGTLEQVDSLKAAYAGAPETGLNVVDHAFDAALDHPGIRARHAGVDALCSTCRACPVVDVCGGGQYPHRYRPGSGFDSPSVYCEDLQKLIAHVSGRLATDLRRLTGVG
jgi:uncharacterized protein